MATKRKTTKKKKAAEPEVEDLRAPIAPTDAGLKRVLDDVRAGLARLQPPAEPEPGDLVAAMMHFYFADGIADGYGQEANQRIELHFVDRNEFRITESFEVAELMRDFDLPDLFERCDRAREAVGQVYNDQNAVSLDFMREAAVAERQGFFQRVVAITPECGRFLVNLVSFEECLFSDRSTQRVQQRLGLDPKSKAVEKFLAELRELLAPWGHLPFQVAPQNDSGKVVLEPALAPASQILRLAAAKKK